MPSRHRAVHRGGNSTRAVGSPPPPPPPDSNGRAGGAGAGADDGSDPSGGPPGADDAALLSAGRGWQPGDGPPPNPPPFRQRTRLTEALLAGPSRMDNYFDDQPGRKLLWLAIAFAAGFYCANTVSLSFGTLAVNDVVAAAVTVGFCEVVSYIYYRAEVVGLPLALANAFKLGVIAALITDALKLQG